MQNIQSTSSVTNEKYWDEEGYRICKHGVREIYYDCLDCAKEQYIERMEEIKKNPERFMPYIPLRFRGCSFDNFIGGDAAKEQCRAFVEKYTREVGRKNPWEGCYSRPDIDGYPGSILLSGNTGCGKTHLAAAICRELVSQGKSGDTFFITVPELLLSIRSTFGVNKISRSKWISEERGGEIPETEDEIIDAYSSIELLILDDLGAEKSSDYTISTLYLIIDRRYRNMLPTIITSNLTIAEIGDKLDARIASRLSEMTVIKINMPDRRKQR